MFQMERTENKHESAEESRQWKIQERIAEITEKIHLKSRDKEATFALLQRKIKDNQLLIRHLRKDITIRRILQHNTLFSDERIISQGLDNNKESRLALMRSTAGKAIEEKNEHVYERIRRLNAAVYRRSVMYRKLFQLHAQLADMREAAIPYQDKVSEQKIQFLAATIDKMKMKCSSVIFIHKIYKKIVYVVEQENMAFPERLRKLEVKLNRKKKEYKTELLAIQKQAKIALEQARADKERMDAKVLKAKKVRDFTLQETRKDLKALKEASSDREYRMLRKHRLPFKQASEETTVHTGATQFRGRGLWEKAKIFVKVRIALDRMQEKLGVNNPFDIITCWQNQNRRTAQLTSTVNELDERRGQVYSTLEKKKDRLSSLEEQYFLMTRDTQVQVALVEEAIKERIMRNKEMCDRLGDMKLKILLVTSAVDNISSKVDSCDELALAARKIRGSDYRLQSTLSEDLVKKFDLETPQREYKALLYCGERLWKLQMSIRQLNRLSSVHRGMMYDLNADHGQDLLVRIISTVPRNERIQFKVEDDFFVEDFLEGNNIDNAGYLTRSAVKFATKLLTSTVNSRRKSKRQRS